MIRWWAPTVATGVALIFAFPTSLIGTSGLVAVVWASFIAGVLKIAQKSTQRQERARLLADCDHQHHAWNAGNDRVAVYGRYQPPTF